MKKKRVLWLMLVTGLVLMLAFTGCTPAEEIASDNIEATATEEVAPLEEEVVTEDDAATEDDTATEETSLRIGLVTKVAGHPIFEGITDGAVAAGAIYGDTIDSQGPTDATAEKQVEIINNFIAQKVDCIAISACDPDAVSPALKKAMEAGIIVVSYDSDVNVDARSLYVNCFDTDSIGKQMVDAAYEATGGEGQIAILSASANATNQNAWIAAMETYLKEDKFKDLELVATVYGDDQMDKSLQEANGLIKSYPDLKCIISPTGVGVIAAAKAVQDAELGGKIVVTGLGLPSQTAEYIKSGVINKAFLYNPYDVGYIAELAARAIALGNATGAEGDIIKVDDMGERSVSLGLNGETQIIVDQAPEFNIDNIDDWAEKF